MNMYSSLLLVLNLKAIIRIAVFNAEIIFSEAEHVNGRIVEFEVF